MPQRTAQARWNGALQDGDGKMAFGSGAYEGAYSFESRFQEGEGTNPEELIGAAHAGCFSMAFANMLDQAGHRAESVETTATVHLDKVDEGFKVTRIVLDTKARVPGIEESEFDRIANEAKAGCPISQLLTGADIELKAELAG